MTTGRRGDRGHRVAGGAVLMLIGAALIWASYNIERRDGSFLFAIIGITYAGAGLVLALAPTDNTTTT